MAKAIVAQAGAACQDSFMEYLSDKKETPQFFAYEILKAGNDEAVKTLKNLGFDSEKFIPGTPFLRFKDFVEFYGVDEAYVKRSMLHLGINRSTPCNDTDYIGVRHMLNYKGYKNSITFNKDLMNEYCHLISARYVLALVCLFTKYRCAKMENNVRKTYEFLKNSDYRLCVDRRKQELKQRGMGITRCKGRSAMAALPDMSNIDTSQEITITMSQLIEFVVIAAKKLNEAETATTEVF